MPSVDKPRRKRDGLATLPYGSAVDTNANAEPPRGKSRRGMKTLPFGRRQAASSLGPTYPGEADESAPTRPFPRHTPSGATAPTPPAKTSAAATPGNEPRLPPADSPVAAHRKWARALTPPPAHERVLGGRYALKRKLGEGGFGIVFEAEDVRLGKRVAIKMLAPRFANQPAALERFRREAIAAGRIGHEGIVDVTDLDQDPDGTYFVAMEFLSGTDLADAIDREGPFSPVRALGIGVQAGRAIAAAHAMGILHRDLKPGNIFLTRTDFRHDNVKIIDFGMSKLTTHTTESASLTTPGQIIGTPYYMAPEQAIEEEVDGRTDVYALGGILYEMLTGTPPFTGSAYLEIVYKHLKTAPEPPSRACPEQGIPAAVDALVMRALEKRKERRYGDMAEFADAMLDLLWSIDHLAASNLRPRRNR